MSSLSSLEHTESSESTNEDDKLKYRIADGVRLLASIRQSHLEFEGITSEGEEHTAFRENKNSVFLADPYKQEDFMEQLKDDVDRITACGRFLEVKPWNQTPRIIIVAILSDPHWRGIYTLIDQELKTAKVLYDDPCGEALTPSELKQTLFSALKEAVEKLVKRQFGDDAAQLGNFEVVEKDYNEAPLHDCGSAVFRSIEDFLCENGEMMVSGNFDDNLFQASTQSRFRDAITIKEEAELQSKHGKLTPEGSRELPKTNVCLDSHFNEDPIRSCTTLRQSSAQRREKMTPQSSIELLGGEGDAQQTSDRLQAQDELLSYNSPIPKHAPIPSCTQKHIPTPNNIRLSGSTRVSSSTHIQNNTHIQGNNHIQSSTHIQSNTPTHVLSNTPTYRNSHILSNTLTHKNPHVQSSSHILSSTPTHKNSHAQSSTHIQSNTPTQKNSHIQTSTHIQSGTPTSRDRSTQKISNIPYNINYNPSPSSNLNYKQNAFNQQEILTYRQSQNDVDTIAGDYLRSTQAQAQSQFQVPATNSAAFIKSTVEDAPGSQCVGLQLLRNQWVCQKMNSDIGVVIFQQKNSLGGKLDELEDELQREFGEKLNIIQLELGSQEQYDDQNSGIFALKNFMVLVANEGVFQQPENNLENLRTRKELGRLQMKIILERFEGWKCKDLLVKRNILDALRPLNYHQFAMVAENESPHEEMKNLLRQAIKTHDPTLAKQILKAGVKINNGVQVDKSRVSFLTLIEHEINNNSGLPDLLLIKRLLIKHGCSAKTELTLEELKSKMQDKMMREVANQNNSNFEMLSEFLVLLKSNLLSTIQGIQTVASEKVSLSLGTVPQIVNKVLDKIPALGSLLCDIFNNFVSKYHMINIKQLAQCFGTNEDIDTIVNDYCIRVVKNQGEEIIKAAEEEALANAEQSWKVVSQVALKALQDQKAGERNNEKWKKLSQKQIENFLEFLTNERSRDFSSTKVAELGIKAAQNLFEVFWVNREDVDRVTDEQGEQNVIFFLKLLAFTRDISIHATAVRKWQAETAQWSDSRKDKEVSISSFIFVNKNKLQMCFNASDYKPSNTYSTQQVSNELKVPLEMQNIQQKFFDGATQHQIGDGKGDKSLGVVLEECAKAQPDAKIYISGHSLGAFVGIMIYLHLINNYKPNKNDIELQIYSEIPWCQHKYMQNAKEILKNQHRIELKDTIQGQANFQHLGECMQLKAGHLLHEEELKALKIEDKSELKDSITDQIQEQNKRDEELDSRLAEISETLTADDYHKSEQGGSEFSEQKSAREINLEQKNLKDAGSESNADPLYAAARAGDFEQVKARLHRGSRMKKQSNQLLRAAIESGNVELVKYVVKVTGADLNAQDSEGQTPLFVAAASGHLEVLKQLVEKGAHVNHMAANGYTPLHIAANKCYPSIAKYLIMQKAHLYTRNFTDNTKPVRQLISKLDKTSAELFILTLKLQSKSLLFKEYERVVEVLLAKGCSLQGITTQFVSECMKLKNPAQVGQFFEGEQKLKIQNSVIKTLLSFQVLDRLEQALEVCRRFADDNHFKFVEGLIQVQEINHYIMPAKLRMNQKDVEETISRLPPSAEGQQLKGEMNLANRQYEQALKQYKEALKYDPSFKQARASILNIRVRQGALAEAKKLQAKLSSQLLSLDVELMLHDCKDTISTEEFINVHAAQTQPQQNFETALRQALTVDVRRAKNELLSMLPKKLSSQRSNLQKVDYAQNLLNSFFGKIFNLGGCKPDNSEHEFFSNINKLVTKLEGFKQGVSNRLTLKDIEGEHVDKQKMINLATEIINQYRKYIDDVVADQMQTQDNNYQARFYSDVGRNLDVNESAQVLTEKGDQQLLQNTASRIITAKPPFNEQQQGTHKIVVYPVDQHPQVFYKYCPQAPGIEYAVTSLHNQIVPNTTPESILIKVSDGARSSIYLATHEIQGKNFGEVINQREVIQTIDMRNFSGLFICSLLVCPGDAKPDNQILKFNQDQKGLKSTQLVSIDNDVAFCREGLGIDPNNNTVYADMLNILYLMPQMDDMVSHSIREQLSKQDPEVIVAQWLNELHSKNQKQLSSSFSERDLNEARLPIQLPPGTAIRIQSQISKIVRLLQSNTITHNEIFKQLYPGVCHFQKKSRDNASIENSLKNLQVAAGADTSLVKLLYSADMVTSQKAWATISAAKRQGYDEFREKFSSSIRREAEHFISMIDFSAKSDLVIMSIKAYLNFIENLELHKISEAQLDVLVDSSFSRLKSVILVDSLVTETPVLANRLKLTHSIERTTERVNFSQKEIKPLNITSIWDLVDAQNRPQDSELVNDRLIKMILKDNLNVNSQDGNGDTALHKAVLLNDRVVAKLLLDCGADKNVKNNNNKSPLDVCSPSNSQLSLMILEQQPNQFWQLIEERRQDEAEVIAERTSQSYLQGLVDGGLVGEEKSLLELSLQDEAMKELAMIILIKIKKIVIKDLIHTMVRNQADSNIDILAVMLEKDKTLVDFRNSEGLLAADIAQSLEKQNMLAQLLNNGSKITNLADDNIYTILKASQYGIMIEAGDFRYTQNHDKTNKDGNNLIHAMCLAKDVDILKQGRKAIDEINTKNGSARTLEDVAISINFFELLEQIYRSQNLYDQDNQHRLAIETNKNVSKLLKDQNYDISIEEARSRINLNSKLDAKGNTVLQKLVKMYIVDSKENKRKILQDIDQLIEYGSDINLTHREDRNTALHLAARSGDVKLCEELMQAPNIDFHKVNFLHQTALDIAVNKNGDLAKMMQERIYGAIVTKEMHGLIISDLAQRGQYDTIKFLNFNIDNGTIGHHALRTDQGDKLFNYNNSEARLRARINLRDKILNANFGEQQFKQLLMNRFSSEVKTGDQIEDAC